MAVWPVGIPLLYGMLLWSCRPAIRAHIPTPLSRTTAFVRPPSGGSRSRCAARKLILCGCVMVIPEEAEQARVIAALFVSIIFFGLNLRFQPLRRTADGSLTTLLHLALILVCTCVLMIKSCELSPNVCSSYGFASVILQKVSSSSSSSLPWPCCLL
eukprot:4209780-Prymnesium_polylepis.1